MKYTGYKAHYVLYWIHFNGILRKMMIMNNINYISNVKFPV